MYNLFLDDIRQPHEPASYMPTGQRSVYLMATWVVVRSHRELVEIIKERGLPNLISFDHDLADEHYHPIECQDVYEYDEEFWKNFYKAAYKEETGYHSAQWLVDYCIDNQEKLPEYLAHTQNPVGKENILSLLNNFKNHQNQTNEQTQRITGEDGSTVSSDQKEST